MYYRTVARTGILACQILDFADSCLPGAPPLGPSFSHPLLSPVALPSQSEYRNRHTQNQKPTQFLRLLTCAAAHGSSNAPPAAACARAASREAMRRYDGEEDCSVCSARLRRVGQILGPDAWSMAAWGWGGPGGVGGGGGVGGAGDYTVVGWVCAVDQVRGMGPQGGAARDSKGHDMCQHAFNPRATAVGAAAGCRKGCRKGVIT
jgi:hypothetical protein